MRTISLVVATRNRAKDFNRLVDSLNNQTFRDFELIVIDQSDERESMKIQKIIEFSDIDAKYIFDKGSGLSRARNIGLNHVTGKLIAFPDDDCWYAPELLKRVFLSFNNERNLTLLSGSYSEPGVKNFYFPNKRQELSLWNVFTCLSSVTMFISFDLFHDICFDERLGVGTDLPSGEDVDLAIRILGHGYYGVYDPDLVVYHKINRPALIESESVLAREVSNMYVLVKNAINLNSVILWIILIRRMIKGFFYSIFSSWGRKTFNSKLLGLNKAIRDNKNGK